MTEPLSKVDSAVGGLSSSPPAKTKRASSSVPGVYNINDLGMFTHTLIRFSAPGGSDTGLDVGD
jgi:hypothetical protein